MTAARIESSHAHPDHEHHVNYMLIFVVLIALTIITVAIAYTRFHNELVNVLLALTVASIKAMLVARFFMHLKFEGKMIWTIFIAPLCCCFLLVFALIPDVAFGRDVLMNDMIGIYEKGVIQKNDPEHAKEAPGTETAAPATTPAAEHPAPGK